MVDPMPQIAQTLQRPSFIRPTHSPMVGSSFGHGIVILEEGLRDSHLSTVQSSALLVLRVSPQRDPHVTAELAKVLSQVTSRRWFSSSDGAFAFEFVRCGGAPQAISSRDTYSVETSNIEVFSAVYDLPIFDEAHRLLHRCFDLAKTRSN